VVLPHPRERDPVVDLRNLVQERRGVLGHEQDAVRVLERHDGAPAGDALAGILRLVLHHLLGADVVGEGHGAHPAAFSARARSPNRVSTTRRISSSATSPNPLRVIVLMVGKMPRIRSGPPAGSSGSSARACSPCPRGTGYRLRPSRNAPARSETVGPFPSPAPRHRRSPPRRGRPT